MDVLTVGPFSPQTAAIQDLAELKAPSWCHRNMQAGAVSGPSSVPPRVVGGSEAQTPVSLPLSSCSILLALIALSPIPSAPCTAP